MGINKFSDLTRTVKYCQNLQKNPHIFSGTQKLSQHINIQPSHCLDENDKDELNFIDQQFFGDHVNHNQSVDSTDDDSDIAT